ncbi:MAG TPA: 2-C-methyl-D-erythritol 2,4-cyclodiphosphate synthase [Planctomycetota bacterium]|nr:2-C-methyl-D-erythritol 2,4-cyclodiphosphate synthase [Planctomycetota bacterium]
MPVGHGFDIHKLVAGRPLLIGGLAIDHPRGLEGHSDGDVLLHAVIDALLGAAGKGDIGDRFPDSNPKLKGIKSSKMLASVLRDVGEFEIVNVDVTLVAEAPKLGPRKREIAAHVSKLLGGAPVNVKAKTAEKLGPVGKGEAIACFAVVELRKAR